MNRLGSQRGQLLLPILAVAFLFGLFWIAYARWCLNIYWHMRMDMAADAVALSAAREEAAMLNTIATAQNAENIYMKKIEVEGEEVDAVELLMEPPFGDSHARLVKSVRAFSGNVKKVARQVAEANGANHPPKPFLPPTLGLKAHGTTIHFIDGFEEVWRQYYPAAYYVRGWRPRKNAPQPIHRTTWLVGHGNIWEMGKACLWLDVNPTDTRDNGGFPTEESGYSNRVGFQCNFPQFNARLLPKFFDHSIYDEIPTHES